MYWVTKQTKSVITCWPNSPASIYIKVFFPGLSLIFNCNFNQFFKVVLFWPQRVIDWGKGQTCDSTAEEGPALVDALVPDKLKARAHTAKQVYTSYTHTHSSLSPSLMALCCQSCTTIITQLWLRPVNQKHYLVRIPICCAGCRAPGIKWIINHPWSTADHLKSLDCFYTKKGQLVFWYCARRIPVVWFFSACDSFIWIPGSGDF